MSSFDLRPRPEGETVGPTIKRVTLDGIEMLIESTPRSMLDREINREIMRITITCWEKEETR